MSYTILQSTKIYLLQDDEGNRAVISGRVSEDNNCSPKDYDTIYFHYAARSKGALCTETVQYATRIMQGCIKLKNGSGKGVEEDIFTMNRRYLRNLNLAKTINVSKIEYQGERVYITFGEDGLNQLKKFEPSFSFYYSQAKETFSLPIYDDSEVGLHYAYRFLNGDRSIESAIELSEYDCYLPALFDKGPITEQQLVALLKNVSEWSHRYIYGRTTTRLSKETAATAFTKKEREEINIAAFTQK